MTHSELPTMEGETGGEHVLVFPYPAQGHMLPLLDLSHQLATRGLTVTILITPKNLPLLNPLLSKHSTAKILVLPFPPHPSIPSGVENVKDLPSGSFHSMMYALGGLYQPLLSWFRAHPSPPVAIISDFFLGWTHNLASELGIRRLVFSPSGVLALSVIYALWKDQPKRIDGGNENEIIPFRKIPNSPVYPWWQLSPVYRWCVENENNEDCDPVPKFIKEGFLGDIESWGLVINSFTELERVYLDYLNTELSGRVRIWTVGPLLPPDHDDGDSERGGPNSVAASKITSWLDTCGYGTVVYASFGSQAVLTNEQMEALAMGLEKSGVRFILAVKKGHVEGSCGMIPNGFEDRVEGRGMVVKGWAPQVIILRHKSVGAFLTHCGWNSTLEAVVAGVPMLAWPMGADQFANATLLVDQLQVAVRVGEGSHTVPDSDKLARSIEEAIIGPKTTWTSRRRRIRALELREVALRAIKKGGISTHNLDDLVSHLSQLAI